MPPSPYLRHLIIGQLRREFILPPLGKPVIDQPGGSLLYAAAGLALWENDSGLVSRVGENFPVEALALVEASGFDIRGIRSISESLDQRWFCAYADVETHHHDRPVAHFSRCNLPFPKALLGYAESTDQVDSRTQPSPITLRSSDIPTDYLEATAAHLCPADFLTHSLIPSALRQGNLTTITIDPSTSYMNQVFWDDFPLLVKGISAFLTSEEKLTSLFQGHCHDLWEMAEATASFGCDVVVIKRGAAGQMVYDHAAHCKWVLPAYPARVNNPTGAGDAFCGGFLAGYKSTYNALEGALAGNISASMVIEGNGPFFALGALPGLANARREALRNMVRQA